ncbi:MAG TPA: aminomethyl-transferring glycine dehydrogenase [Kofleriaceae bacterium]|nr:aminomethyl-transferring glycine dehydrogenase [Kofleriaceae bacterium]
MIGRDDLEPYDLFSHRHLGSEGTELDGLLKTVGVPTLEALADAVVPAGIRLAHGLDIGPQRSEAQALAELRALASKNQVWRSYIGMGYHGTVTPPAIQRNILENPGWYTQYTPYQPEISQGRLEMLLCFQTVVADLTGLPMANASLLDEATAAAEAMHMSFALAPGERTRFFAAADCHPQTLAVLATRAGAAGIALEVGPIDALRPGPDLAGALLQYPASDGRVVDPSAAIARIREAGAVAVVATDLLALALLRPPGELGADIAIGSSQRFGVPMGYGGPHAGFMACRDEHKRQMPGRLVGVSRDAAGKPAYRLALQTREQHIRREKATSNICTAQVLLAITATAYAIYHGPDGLRRIARRVHGWTALLAAGLRRLGWDVGDLPFFDTLTVRGDAARLRPVVAAAAARRINLRVRDDGLGIALDETVGEADVRDLLDCFAGGKTAPAIDELARDADAGYPTTLARTSAFLTHETFHRYHQEHELLRFLKRLEARDLSLTTSMIPLGSCTMKLNAAAEMLPITWPELAGLHPFAPAEQAAGYAELFRDLERWLAEITGFAAVSLQPNSGAQGEYAGLLVIREYHERRGQGHRNICLIPVSAHGTNPASAVMAGYQVVVVACDDGGNVDLDDLRAKAAEHADKLACLMITYPSTHGVFEPGIRDICAAVHQHGGQVYMDGANMNAQVGLCRPGDFGADVCHLNLHKTFCIPHGGGGPGMGPIAVAAHLQPFLPGHPLMAVGGDQAIGPVSAAPYGSPMILPIPWAYIRMMGSAGLTRATQLAILNANYIARRLAGHYEVLYRGPGGWVAHELIIDCRAFKKSAGIAVDDIAKRLMDYGFHAPTMSFPVAGTLMIEPTESESKAELDRLCDALIGIREEIRAIEEGRADAEDNPLRRAPHTAAAVTAAAWDHRYAREQAAFPAPWLRDHKYWPPVARIDNAYGDRNLVCTCPSPESYK